MTSESSVSLTAGRPLAPMQRALWMSQRLHPDAPVQNMALLTHIAGPVDGGRLADAFETVVDHIDVLRTRIVDDRGTPLIKLDATRQPPTVLSMPRNDAERLARERVRVPIDATERGYDSVIIEHPDGTASWYLALHHTITDATSSAMVFAATADVYDEKPIDVPSYYAWSRRFDAGSGSVGGEPQAKRRVQAIEYWRQRVQAPRIDRLYRPITSPGPTADRLPVSIDDRLIASLDERLATDYRLLSPDLSWTALLMTVTAAYLHQVSGSVEFSLGLPVHNRTDAEARALIGPIMEVFPVDVTITAGLTFRSLHKQLSRSIMTTLGNAVPGAAPIPDYSAVVNVIPRAAVGSFGALTTTTQWIHSGAIDSSHLLRVQLSAYEDPESGSTTKRPSLALDLNHSAAEADHRRRAPGHFLRVLEAMADDPDQRITVPLPATEELEAIVAWESSDDFEGQTPDVVSQLRVALQDRHTITVREGERHWTGAELWQDVQRTAGALRTLGVITGDRVGIEIPRSAEAVIAILAVLVVGGSFVPLDPALPLRKRKALSERAGCRLVLSSLPATGDDPATGPLASPGPTEPGPTEPGPTEPDLDLDREAYLLFTSGSTGRPKGVPITHLGLARYLRFAIARYVDAEGPAPIVPLFSALSFDLTITSLFLPLLTGGEQIIIGADGPAALAALAKEPTINWCKATPSHLEVLIRLLPPDHALHTAVVGGEAFGSGLARRLLEFNHEMAIFNEYGPTEAVVGCMIHQVDPARVADEQEVPIGVPAPGVRLRVVGPGLERTPLGSAGELCISHPGVTSGYLIETSAEAGADPFVELDSCRFYRSGDLVRLADDRALVYLGRIDEQVKVGGIRLEPIEVEEAIVSHPAIARAAVRLWTPTLREAGQRCVTCGLPSNVPGASFDDVGVCSTCRDYERVVPQTVDWFRTPADLRSKRDEARAKRTGRYDCLHLMSGGKDSTYALYQLVEAGFEPYAFTLDNGFISEGAKDNVRRSVADLGIDHEFATTEAMNAIFRDSLDRHSNVCHGCYKTIYTLATTRAAELGIPMIVTGLSRGQLFETRLIPQQFAAGRFDPDAIDRAVIEARKTYHRLDDGPNRLLDTDVFADDEIFEQIEYLDYYRYVDVELAELLDYLESNAPWVRPSDTGRSTNCLINAAGIHTHLIEQGYHNYAIPYAWDVRLGHKTRDEAIDELDDRLVSDEVDQLLRAVGYTPKPAEVLTAWLEPEPAAVAPSPAELRAFLAESLPSHAIPAAFVTVDELPMTMNGKLDTSALPPPERVHRTSTGIQIEAETELEATIIGIWERLLRLEPIGTEDDFFALGGDSLGALEMIVALGDALGRPLDDELAFGHTTPRALALAIDEAPPRAVAAGAESGNVRSRSTAPASPPLPIAWSAENPPPLSPGEQAILFEQTASPDSVKYNVGRLYRVGGAVDADAVEAAIRRIASSHVPLTWTYGRPRRRLGADEAVVVTIGTEPMGSEDLDEHLALVHREPFVLDNGPLLRVLIQPMDDTSTVILLVCHHLSGDAGSFDRLWAQLDGELRGRPFEQPPIDYATFTQWQQGQLTDADRDHWRVDSDAPSAVGMLLDPPAAPGPDGFRTRVASVAPAELRRRRRTSGFAMATAALVATLRRYTTGDEVSVGLVSSSRNHPTAEQLFGYFLNTLPLDIACSLDESLDRLTTRVSSAVAGNLAHRSYPYSRIVADRRVAGAPGPGTQVLLAYDELGTTTLNGLPVEQKVLSNGSAVTDVTIFVELLDERVDLSIEHRGSVMDPQLAEQLLTDFDTMLSAIARLSDVIGDDRVTVGAVELPSTAHSILVGAEFDPPPHLMDLITANTRTIGAEPAVVCGDDAISWSQLDSLSGALASALAEAGVVRGDRVIVEMARSVELAVGIVAVLRAGAVYVPVDPTYPDERIELVRGRAEAAALLVDAETARRVASIDEPVIVVDLEGLSRATADRRPVEPSGDDVAYVIFTSGSTGLPRGVPVTHRQLAASTLARRGVYEQAAGRFLVVSSPAFDSSIAGLFWALADGGTIVFPSDADVHDPDRLIALFDQHRITNTLMVPSLYNAILDRAPEAAAWPQQIIVAGEACPPALVAAHFERHPMSALTNEYGPTEATVWASAHHCRPGDDPVPIGLPVPGTWLTVVDDAGEPRPNDVPGELLIGGLGVVDGYIADEAGTVSRFGDGANGRFFRTGDRAVMRNGLVHFLGRIDDQLNVGGVRAEPEDIERALVADPAVGAAVVTAIDLRPLDELIQTADQVQVAAAIRNAAASPQPAETLLRTLRTMSASRLRLVAFVESATATLPVDVDSVREQAASRLPPLLRPSLVVPMSVLPRTPNGKIDRKAAAALPINTAVPLPAAAVEPAGSGDDLDGRISALFAEVLHRSTVGLDESFFDAGGHSLLALDLLFRLETELAVEVTVSTLYERPTAREVAAFVREVGPAPVQNRFLVPIQPNGDRPPIFGIHVLGHNAEFYRPLAERLGPDQPIWGLGLPTNTPDTSGPTEVTEVAARYADELEICAPDGPITLAAISLGSVVAFELARQLRARGRHVALLALFDAAGPSSDKWALTSSERLGVHARELASGPRRYVIARLARLRARLGRQSEIAALRARRVLRLPVPTELKVRAFVEANWEAQAAYDFQPYSGPIVVYKAGDDPFTRRLANAGMGWAEVADGPFKVSVVPGGHLSMLAEPHVATLASVLAADQLEALADPASVAVTRPATRHSREAVEALLVEALGRGEIAVAVARLLSQVQGLAPEATELVHRCDRSTTNLADRANEQSAFAHQALAEAGIDARVEPIPSRLAHCMFRLHLDAMAEIGDLDRRFKILDSALGALAGLGYRPQQRLDAASLPYLAAGATGCVLLNDDATVRLDLNWGHDRAPAALPDQATALASTGDEPDLGVYLGTPMSIVTSILGLAEPSAGDLVVDLGCGDGRVLIQAARSYGCRGRGIENDPLLVAEARSNVAAAGLGDLVEIVEADASSAALGDADIVFAFLPPRVIAVILPDLLERLPPGARLVAHEQLSIDWPVPPDHSELIVGDHLTVAHLWRV